MVMLDFICMVSADLFGTGRERKIQNENLYLQQDSNSRRHATRDEAALKTARPRRLDGVPWLNVLHDSWIQIYKTITCQ